MKFTIHTRLEKNSGLLNLRVVEADNEVQAVLNLHCGSRVDEPLRPGERMVAWSPDLPDVRGGVKSDDDLYTEAMRHGRIIARTGHHGIPIPMLAGRQWTITEDIVDSIIRVCVEDRDPSTRDGNRTAVGQISIYQVLGLSIAPTAFVAAAAVRDVVGVCKHGVVINYVCGDCEIERAKDEAPHTPIKRLKPGGGLLAKLAVQETVYHCGKHGIIHSTPVCGMCDKENVVDAEIEKDPANDAMRERDLRPHRPAQAPAFDPFKDFTVKSSTQEQGSARSPFGTSPDLAPTSHQLDPAHGSALMRLGKL